MEEEKQGMKQTQKEQEEWQAESLLAPKKEDEGRTEAQQTGKMGRWESQ